MDTNIEELAELAQHVLDLEAAADEASTRIEALQAEIATHRAAKDRLAEARYNMAQALLTADGIEEIIVAGTSFTARLSAGTLEIDEAGVPDDLKTETVKTITTINKAAIKERIKAGEDLNYARLVQKPSLTLKGSRAQDTVRRSGLSFDDL